MFDFENTPISETPVTPEAPQAPEAPKAPETPEPPKAPEAPKAPAVDLDYVLKQISAIQADTGLLKETLAQIATMGPQDAAKICAMKDMVTVRETTNQQLLDFYMVLYNDHKRPIVDTEWVENTARSAGEAARKAGKVAKETAKDWGGKMKTWFKDLSEEDWDGKMKEQIRKAKARSLKEKVLNALRDPDLDEESRELLLENIERLKTLSEEMQDQVLSIILDDDLVLEEKTRILENLDAINGLDD